MSFTWSNGRQLTTLQKNSSVVNYTYNADGVRIGKSGSKNVTFEVAGNLILSEKSGTQTTYYLYDEKGSPVGLFFGSNTYYYRKNLQGDIIAIVDYAGTKVAEYRYNAWGELIYLGGSNMSIATNNHLRYRGYYYDEESGFYYLNSRYYDPEIGRFINADNQLTVGSDLTGLNLFAYCGNNPVNRIDLYGESGAAVLTWWSSTMWAPAVAEPSPIGEILFGVGCLVLGIVSVIEITTTATSNDTIYIEANAKQGYDNDPYRRPNQKKQERERKEKKKNGKDWKPNPNKRIKPPKKHTPGRDHRKY